MPRSELHGTIVPLVTPFDAGESFDAPALRRLIAWVLEQGADALMPTALTGEGPMLTEDETLAVWDVVFEEAGDRVPVVPAVIATTTGRAVRLVQAAQARGAGAVMAAPILAELYAGRSGADALGFYADVGNATSLPILLFNSPALTGIDLTPDLVARLAAIDNVRYIKESSGDARRVHRIQRLLGDRLSVICGAPDTALESLALGCRAWITGVMNVAPRSARQLMRAVRERRDLALARRIYYQQILPLVDMLTRNSNATGTIKAGVSARGLSVGVPRRPGSDIAREDRRALETLVAEIERAEAQTAGELDSAVA